jgi:signal transduction histidine kinase
MQDTQIEPGLLPVFRLFMTVLLALHLLQRLTPDAHENALPRPSASVFAILIISAFLLVYLSWPQLQRRLGALYLPLALLAASLAPIVGQYLTFRNQPGLSPVQYDDYVWQQTLLLIFPLLLISWQYKFRWAVSFSLGTGIIDFILTSLTASHSELEGSLYMRVLLTRMLVFLAVGYVVTRLVRAQREQRQSLREANARLVDHAATLEQLTISRERNRLARELHDTLAHTLSGVAVQLEAVKSLWDVNAEEARALLEQSLNHTRSGLTETRRALKALRATPLEDLGLALALRNLAETMAERSSLGLDLHIQANFNHLSAGIEQGVYRVAQEALENTIQHAQARHVKVELVKNDENLTLTIMDDGRGFDPHAVDGERHFGLKGMRERAETMGGSLEVKSRPGEGTMVRLQVGLCQHES